MLARLFVFLLGLFMCFPLFGKEERIVHIDDLLQEIKELSKGQGPIEADTNENGNIDYLLIMSKEGYKIAEVLDYNHDGSMDDFYLYHNGVLSKRLIDSNYDNYINIWVYLSEGVYVKKYEQDSNHDGVIDRVKIFGEDNQD